MYKLRLFLFMICASCMISSVDAQITSPQIDSLVKTALENLNVVGAAVAVVKDGKIVHSKGYGVKSIQTKEKVDKHTNFAIASNSKAFTSAALALLIEEGKLSWTDKVKDHIPEFKMYNPYVTENFNIQDLLTHRSGLGLGVGDLMFFPNGSSFTMEDLLNSFQYFEPVSAFRTKFDYDNLLYFVAGEVIKRISGMSWEQFVTERILQPLGMEGSLASLDEANSSTNLAMPHIIKDSKPHQVEAEKLIINGAAGGLISNVEDICKWMMLQLNKGKYGASLEKQLFSEENQREMWQIHTTLPASKNPRYNSHFRGYGLGWVLSDALGNMVVTHTGGLVGMLSKTILVPDQNLGIIVFTNTSYSGGAFFNAVSQTIFDSYLGLDDNNWVNKFTDNGSAGVDTTIQQVWAVVNNGQKRNISNKDYTGIYKDNWFGKVEIFEKDGKLRFTALKSPKLIGQLQHYKANTFAIKWEGFEDLYTDTFAKFSLDEEGNAVGIKMKGISDRIDFSYDFHDLDLKRITEH